MIKMMRMRMSGSIDAQLTLALLSFIFGAALGSSCTDDQVNECKKAVQRDMLSTLPGGGVCTKRQYVHYTHECKMTDYTSYSYIDFCCCALDQKVLCCRYRQNADRFRCSEPEDTIAVVPWGDPSAPSTNHGPFSESSHRVWPLKLLLPVIIVPLLLGSCCIVCCLHHCYKRRLLRRKRRKTTHQQSQLAASLSTGAASMQPFSSGRQIGAPSERAGRHSPDDVAMLDDYNKRPLEPVPDRTSLEPSAPPCDSLAPPYSERDPCLGGPHSLENHHHYPPLLSHGRPNGDYTRQFSDTSAGSHHSSGQYGGLETPHSGHYSGLDTPHITCPSCSGHTCAAGCAPPDYEESLNHRIMPH